MHSNLSVYRLCKNITYKTIGENDDRSVFVVPRRVYFDNRLHQGKPRNSILILAEVHDYAVKTIVACELNGFYSNSISITKEDTAWVRKKKPGHTHCVVVVECRGLPLESVVNGTFAKLIYKKSGEEFYSCVATEKPLFLRTSIFTPVRGKSSVVVCTTMYGHPPMFNYWLMYQQTLGLDGVHINADSTFSYNSTTLYPFLKESLNNGFVQIETWNNIVGNHRMYYYGQMTKYQDCIFRHMNVFEYVLLYDYDDYFNPVIPQKNIHFYMNEFFSKSNTGTVLMPWRQMNCRPTEEKCKTLIDGNLTSILSGYSITKRPEAKCAHRLNAVMFVSIHSSKKRLPGYTSIRSSDKLAYVAHNRYSNKLCTV